MPTEAQIRRGKREIDMLILLTRIAECMGVEAHAYSPDMKAKLGDLILFERGNRYLVERVRAVATNGSTIALDAASPLLRDGPLSLERMTEALTNLQTLMKTAFWHGVKEGKKEAAGEENA